MKNLIILFFFINSFGVIFPQANYTNFDHFFGIQLNTGLTFFNLNPLKNDFKSSVEMVSRNYNLPLQIQHLYPTNISWSGNVFWYFSPEFCLVLGPEYTSTRAFSMYEDYAGTFDLKSEIHQYYLSIGVRKHFNDVKIVQPLIGVNFGLVQFNFMNTMDLNVNNGQIKNHNSYEYLDNGYSIEIYTGLTYDIKIGVVELIASYRYVKLEEILIEPDNFNIKLGIKRGIFK
ncbi:MAG: hypothetical protein Q8N83_00135 [Ignavibacteria bacterium]|nr:hypothetical protein [Ignavibacteria bacterium]